MNNAPTKLDLTPTECNDCGGPLAQAFPTTRDYSRCRRCGHVTPVLTHEPFIARTDNGPTFHAWR